MYCTKQFKRAWEKGVVLVSYVAVEVCLFLEEMLIQEGLQYSQRLPSSEKLSPPGGHVCTTPVITVFISRIWQLYFESLVPPCLNIYPVYCFWINTL